MGRESRKSHPLDPVICLLALVAALPLAWLSLVYALAFRSAIFLGYWPSYNHPDPKQLPARFDAFLPGLTIGLPLALILVQAIPIASYSLRASRPTRGVALTLSFGLATGLIAMGLTVMDPAGVLEWFAD